VVIIVHLHTILQRQTPEGLVKRLEVSLPPYSTLEDLLKDLEIELSPEALLIAVNGRVALSNHQLRDGDEVNLMPAISGGCSPEAAPDESQPAVRPMIGLSLTCDHRVLDGAAGARLLTSVVELIAESYYLFV